MNIDYSEALATIISLVIVPGLLWLGKQAANYLQEKSKNDKLDKYIKIASDCVADAVMDTAQTFVDKIKDQEWNDQTKQQAFDAAKEKAIEHLGLTGKELLTEAFGDFDGWINSKIEAEVKRQVVVA
jgi:uncharacterized protein (UPF0305 family)